MTNVEKQLSGIRHEIAIIREGRVHRRRSHDILNVLLRRERQLEDQLRFLKSKTQ